MISIYNINKIYVYFAKINNKLIKKTNNTTIIVKWIWRVLFNCLQIKLDDCIK